MQSTVPAARVAYKQFMAIILAQFVVLLPHAFHFPVLFSVLTLGTVTALLIMAKRRNPFSPKTNRFFQYGVVIAGLAIIIITYQTILGVDAGVAFLSLCLIGKLFELNQRRDAYIALTLSLFVVASLFLFEQSIFNAIMAMAGIVVVLYAMLQQNINPDVLQHHSSQLANHKPDVADPAHGLWKPLLRLLFQAIPLLIILFIFFPRIPPLWSVPTSQSQGKTGMTNEMSPGNIASLSQSTELSFRVLDPQNNLQNNLPPRSSLYWRGLVLTRFDGTSWTQLKDYRADSPVWSAMQYQPDWFRQNIPANARVGFNYQVLLEPTQQPWLFALDTPISNSRRVGLTREYNLKSAGEIYQRFSYNATQLNGIKPDLDLPVWMAQATLQLPEGSNPRTRQLAQQIFSQVGRDPQRYADYWLNWIRQQNFVYTLEPPTLSGQRIDQFLFDTRRGFCEHYSSAYTFLMRAAGIPARVVVGYQGGEFAPDRQSWEVRQLDAHAWVEIWLAGKGWVRVDPTAAIAPERVERGMNNFIQQNQRVFGEGALSQLRYNQFKALGQVRAWADYASYVWQRDVVGFDQSQQQGLLQRLLGIKSLYAQMLWLIGSFSLLLGVIIAIMWWRRRKVWHPIDAPLQQLSRKLGKQHLARRDTEGMINWLERLSAHPNYEQPAQQLIALYQQARYAPIKDLQQQQHLLRQMKKLVSSWPNSPQ